MRYILTLTLIGLVAAALPGCNEEEADASTSSSNLDDGATEMECLILTEDQWKQRLDSEQYRILREKGTEVPFHNRYWNEHAAGTYHCAACDAPLFSSDTKFESGTGWPSFFQPVSPDAVLTETDTSHGMVRTEVMCRKCGGHLGHVFDDGPNPTRLRFCINSGSLQLKPAPQTH